MADTGGFFGNLMARLLPGGNQPSTGAGFGGTNIPTLPQTWSRLTGGNVQDQGLGRAFDQQYGDFTSAGIERNNAAIWGEPQALMRSADESDPNAHPSQLRESGHTIVPMGSTSRGPSRNSASGNLQSLGGMGRTVGHATMGQVHEMLSSGMRGRGERQIFSPHEINDERAEAKAKGMTLAQYRNRS